MADAELGRGAFLDNDVSTFVRIGSAALSQGQIGEAGIRALFCGDHAEAKSRAVVLRPLVYRLRTEHGRRRSSLPDIVTPIATRATVFRDGGIAIHPTTVVPRDLLEPLDRNAFTIGTVAALDKFLTRSPETRQSKEEETDTIPWQTYQAHCSLLAEAVFPGLADEAQFERMDDGLIEPGGKLSGASKQIGALYDHLDKDQPAVPLFSTFASQPRVETETCLASHAGFAARLGHSNPNYALAEAQRNALNHLLVARPGEIVAVNGPPGTGKTTLLLSVVASLWAKAALEQAAPPLILAASNNNQAVTNIIDAFGADFSPGSGPFAGRWLPELTSFGSYFPAESRRQNAGGYLTPDFFLRVEDADYLDRAKAAFLNAAAVAFPDLGNATIETVVERLHARLTAQADALRTIERAWDVLVTARKRIHAVCGGDPKSVREQRRQNLEAVEARNHRAEQLVETWDRHQGGESLFLLFLGSLPPVRRKRLANARSALRPHWPGDLPEWTRIGDIAPAVTRALEEARAAVAKAKASLAEFDELLQLEKVSQDQWCAALQVLQLEPTETSLLTLADCDPVADRLLRFPIFLTTTHYWEGRWLIEMAGIENLTDEKRRRARRFLVPRWRRRMMLTPCAVSTFYVLPDLMRASRHEDGAFVSDYLYDNVDLLIVDEAGQVSPEVAGAAFALSKQALVIGDTAQIEPIWNVPGRVDAGNLLDAGLLTRENEKSGLNPFAETGRAASSGSVMRVAQHVSRYHQDQDFARGLLLYEHRRCFDEIIGYCNDLCYHGKLTPLRGSKANATGFGEDGLPALGYLQVDGLCEQLAGGSRRNLAEAKTIAAWIADQQPGLQQRYPGRTLPEIIGIVTPFAAQVNAIRGALRDVGIDIAPGKGVTVGSVHAFQGAQRPVMIFSPTYSKHADGSFIDATARMLNVAVSRAMNTFLVFGDMDCFSTAPRSSPRGQLGARLFAAPGNALHFEPAPRRDLMRQGTLERLGDKEAHDAFLRDVLARSQREVQVVTPWLTQRALQESGLVPALAAAVTRGVALTVYTDRKLNADRIACGAMGVDEAIRTLRDIGAVLIEVCGVHSKIVMADDDLFCAGSFNWFSAARDGDYVRHETSLVYRGADVAAEIEATKRSLAKRITAR